MTDTNLLSSKIGGYVLDYSPSKHRDGL